MGLKATDSCLAKVKDDEPIFVLRAQDAYAPILVRFWANLVASQYRKEGRTMTPKVKEAEVLALQMEDWQRANAAKVPD